MKQQVLGTEIICDGCGDTFESLNGYKAIIGDKNGNEIESEAESSDWLIICDKHYCPNCYEVDDDDHYHTKDGKVWDANTKKEI